MMKKGNENSIVKKEDSLTKFDPQKKKGLVVRGLRDTQKTLVLVFHKQDEKVHFLLEDKIREVFGDKLNIIHFYSPEDALDYLIHNEVDLIISGMHYYRKLLAVSSSLLDACKALYPKLPFILWFHGIKNLMSILDSKPDCFINHRYDNPDTSEILNSVRSLLDKSYNTAEVNKKILANDVDALLGLGEAYRHLRKYQNPEEKYQEAIDIFKKVIKIDPSNPFAYAHLGRALYDSGKKYKAIEALKQAMRLNIGHSESWPYVCLGSVYDDMERYAEAIEAYKQAIAIEPSARLGFESVINRLGDIYRYDVGQYSEAIEAYKQALRLEPDKADIYRDIGDAYLKSKQYSKAIEAYKQAIQLFDSKGEKDHHNNFYNFAHYGLGLSFLEIGQRSKAIEEYQILKKLRSSWAEELFEKIYK